MTESDRRIVAERADHYCEYCFSQGLISHDDFAVEHIRPRADGGSESLDNLAWSCQGCNNRKYTTQEAIDPATGLTARLYNPRAERWRDHFIWGDDFTRIEGVSPTGRATVVRLDLNRAGVVNLRRALRFGGYHPPRLALFEPESTKI
ncbi:MAG: HNH endonuclease [Akkermansiaceae bacterium]|nr:HNH endonuclease [Armatimonadota bacterium]